MRHELEQYCRSEARGALGVASPFGVIENLTCCVGEQCKLCSPDAAERKNMGLEDSRPWLSALAALEYPHEYARGSARTWRCSVPACTPPFMVKK